MVYISKRKLADYWCCLLIFQRFASMEQETTFIWKRLDEGNPPKWGVVLHVSHCTEFPSTVVHLLGLYPEGKNCAWPSSLSQNPVQLKCLCLNNVFLFDLKGTAQSKGQTLHGTHFLDVNFFLCSFVLNLFYIYHSCIIVFTLAIVLTVLCMLLYYK